MRSLPTKNYKLTSKRKAFTLMEILIAASIFAGVMIMTTGVLAQSSSFRGKIKATRDTTEVTKKIADMVTRDVRSADSVAKLQIKAGDPIYTFDSGIVLIRISGMATNGYFIKFSSTPASIVPGDAFSVNTADALVIATKDKYKIYLSAGSSTPGGVFYKEYPRLNANGTVYLLTGDDIGHVLRQNVAVPVANEANRISSSNASSIMIMTGFAPDGNATEKGQPYVRFRIMSKTKDYDTLPPSSRSKMEILSTVTVRNFAN